MSPFKIRVKRLFVELAALALSWAALALLPCSAQPAPLDRSQAHTVEAVAANKHAQPHTVEVAVVAPPEVFASLTKLYANPELQLAVARTKIKNHTGEAIKNVKVRSRLSGFTADWSVWEQRAELAPGKALDVAYHPVLDMQKMASLNGTCPANLEVEYQYELADGTVVHETIARAVKVLSRNQAMIVNSALDSASPDGRTFKSYEVVLAAMVTPEDPIIQQVAGMIANQAGGVPASMNDASAIKFMEALYDFMAANIVYETPSVREVNGQFCQHVKYGRDVLRDRAGTCIDLAILYASVCEAVGLKPQLFLIPGHCFPGVEMPLTHKLVCVETTGIHHINFKQARTRGSEEVKPVQDGKDNHFQVDVKDLHDQGIIGMELPALPPTALNDWGIQSVKPKSADGGKEPKPEKEHAAQTDFNHLFVVERE